MENLKSLEEKHKNSLMETIGTRLWLGLDELMRTMGFGKSKTEKNTPNDHQITEQLEKYEKKIISKRSVL